MKSYLTIEEAAQLWNLSPRQAVCLCRNGKIPGAVKAGDRWQIPAESPKPQTAQPTDRLRPFVKWAGGKKQLLGHLQAIYPAQLGKTITKYAEPFVGGGAALLDILSRYPVEEVYISDTNRQLINTYQIVQSRPLELIMLLEDMEKEYLPLAEESRKKYYYQKRERFNSLKQISSLEEAALFIFLNHTCFNGLYRVNRHGFFNVPIGSYKKPCICDKENLLGVSAALEDVRIVCGDYRQAAEFIDQNTFAYFDPPYRPLSSTAAFTSYTENGFDDHAQEDLAAFILEMSGRGAKIALSNSDPKNTDITDDFFERLYPELTIRRIPASRMINSKSGGRGKINELLVTNY